MRKPVHLLAAAMAALLLCLIAGCASGGQRQDAQRQPTSTSATPIQPTAHSTASVGTTEPTTSSAEAQVADQIPECSALGPFRYPMLYVPKISNGKIAFARNPSPGNANSEIYVMNADGTNRSRLTNTQALEWTPTLSPDGKKIAFIRQCDTYDVYVMNADGTDQTRLTNTLGIEWGPAWSPDGNKIAFVSNRDGDYNDYNIYMMNADGSSQTRLTSEVRVDLAGPAFSPDGEKITFIGSRGGDYINSNIYIMNVDGTGLTHLTNIT